MPLEATDILDLANATRPKTLKDRRTDLATSFKSLIAMNTLMANHRVTFDGGDQLEFFVKTSYTTRPGTADCTTRTP